jgi:hypothetical protein
VAALDDREREAVLEVPDSQPIAARRLLSRRAASPSASLPKSMTLGDAKPAFPSRNVCRARSAPRRQAARAAGSHDDGAARDPGR